jgi:secreted trypsin-like serine protease
LVCGGKLVGITSNGRGCALVNFPGIYIDVNFYRDWISSRNSSSSKFNILRMITILSPIFIALIF